MRYFFIAIILILVTVSLAFSQYFNEDDFEDGDWTQNPQWQLLDQPDGVGMVPGGYDNSQWCVELFEYNGLGYGTMSIPLEPVDEFNIRFWVKKRPNLSNNHFMVEITDCDFAHNTGFKFYEHDGIIEIQWLGNSIGSTNIDFSEDRWYPVRMNRHLDGTWNLYWDNELLFENIQDGFDVLEEPRFTILGLGHFNEGGILFDNITLLDEPCELAIFALNSIWIRQNATIHSGDIWANTISEGPYLADGCELTVGIGSYVADGIDVRANKIKVKNNGVVDGNVTYNELIGLGTVNGELTTPLEPLPLVDPENMPTFPEFAAGVDDIEVSRNDSSALDAGEYGNLRIRNGGTVTFTGGIYTFNEIRSGDNSRLLFLDESEIRIVDKFKAESGSYIGPAETADITASEIVFYVAGINGNNGNLGATPKAAHVGLNNELFANLYVPNGTMLIKQGSNATGSFFGKDVQIGIGVEVEYDGCFDFQDDILEEGNYAISMDGTSGFGEVPFNEAYNFGDGDFTIEAIVNIDHIPTGNQAGWIVSRLDSEVNGNYYGFFLNKEDAGGLLSFNTNSDGLEIVCYTEDEAPIHEWLHIAGVRDGDEVIFYVNGLEVDRDLHSGECDSDGNLMFGAQLRDEVMSRYFPGIIDEVRMWNDARTGIEIAENAFAELTGDEENLVGLWQFNEGEGNSFSDSSPNNNSGILHGGYEWIEADWNYRDQIVEQSFELGNTGEMIDMVWIPPGSFWMGAQDNEVDAHADEYPRHQVTISEGFWMGKYEVTQSQWEAVTGYQNFNWPGNPDKPAEMVSWIEINDDFLTEINSHEINAPWRLPTEAEWEYACRAGYDETWFWWGDGYEQLGNHDWYSENSDNHTHEVGQKIPNPFGLYDMSGNVSEWCSDWYGDNYYEVSPSTDPQGPGTGSLRVIRMSAWSSPDVHCRAGTRAADLPGNVSMHVGFRLVRSGEAVGKIAAIQSELPTEYTISKVYPNPFNPVVNITVSLASTGNLKVNIFNILGQRVKSLVNNRFEAGYHNFTFDGSNLSSGIYFIHANVPGRMDEIRKVVLMK